MANRTLNHPPTIPTIDISPFLDPNPSPVSVSHCISALNAACTSPGFFYLTNHNLPESLNSNVLSLAREFFTTSPQETKNQIARKDVGVEDGDGARGYQVIGDNITEGRRDWHEAIDFYRPILDGEPFSISPLDAKPARIDLSSQSGCALSREEDAPPSKAHPPIHQKPKTCRSPPYTLIQGMNKWPSHLPSFRPVYESYITAMFTLGTAVVRALGLALGNGLDETFLRSTRRSFWVMRAIGYPPLPSSSPSSSISSSSASDDSSPLSCGAHTDYGFVTLLLADSTKGALEVWVDGEWVKADPVPGALVVNIGDMMERWSRGRWKSTRHRVVHRGKGYRVSVPFFFEPEWEARVPGKEGEGEMIYGEYLMGKVRGNF